MIIESSGIHELAVAISKAPAEIVPKIGQVVSKGALNVKNQIREDFLDSDSFDSTKPGGVAANVRYNRNVQANSIEAEISPFIDQEGYGSLTDIAIHGGSRGGGGSVADPLIALQAEEPRFIAAIEDLAGEILG